MRHPSAGKAGCTAEACEQPAWCFPLEPARRLHTQCQRVSSWQGLPPLPPSQRPHRNSISRHARGTQLLHLAGGPVRSATALQAVGAGVLAVSQGGRRLLPWRRRDKLLSACCLACRRCPLHEPIAVAAACCSL